MSMILFLLFYALGYILSFRVLKNSVKYKAWTNNDKIDVSVLATGSWIIVLFKMVKML